MKKYLLLLLAICLMVPAISSHSEAASKGKILVVASSENRMALKDGSLMDVGFFLNELAVPTQYLADHGYDIVLATPSGKLATMDASSNDKKFFGGDEAARKNAVDFVEHLPVITLKSAAAGDISQYDAVFIPGGHAPMTDLMQDKDLGTILRYAHEHNIVTAAICHGPVALLAALPDAAAYRTALASDDVRAAVKNADGWIYSGYQMTVLSDAEEWPGEVAKGTQMPFHVEQALQIAGGTMVEQSLYQSHVVRDRELITGQNPASDIALGKAIDGAIQEK